MIQQSRCRRAGGDIAADHLDMRKVVLDPPDAIQHSLRMAVRGIHHDHVHTRLGQQRDAVFGSLAHPDRRTGTQTAMTVLASERVFAGFKDVLYRHQAAQFECIVHHQHALDAVLVHQVAGLFQAGVFLDGDEAFMRSHDVLDRLIQIAFEAQVAVGDDPDQFFALHHRQAGDLVLTGQTQHVAHRHVRRDGDGILDHAAFKALHFRNLGSLGMGRHVLVQDADPAFLRQRDRKTGLGHGIHRRGQQRDVQTDVAGKLGAQTDIARQYV